MPSIPLWRRWSRHGCSPWNTGGGHGGRQKTSHPEARPGPQRANSQWLWPSHGEVCKVLCEFFRHHVSVFPTSIGPSNFRFHCDITVIHIFFSTVWNRSARTGSENFSMLSGKTCNDCAPWQGQLSLTEKGLTTSILFWRGPYSIHHLLSGPEVLPMNTKLFS